EPVQVIEAAPQEPLPLLDLSEIRQEHQDQQVQRQARLEARQPFDLAEGPLLRVWLLRVSRQDHVLLLSMHHIISDAWSRAILVNELSTLYNAFVAGQPSPLA